MIEGGAIDWANHANLAGKMIGEAAILTLWFPAVFIAMEKGCRQSTYHTQLYRHPKFSMEIPFFAVFLVFLIFPIYLIPFLEERFETRLRTDCANARQHVLIYRNGPAVASLIDELKQLSVTPIIIEEDEAEAGAAIPRSCYGQSIFLTLLSLMNS